MNKNKSFETERLLLLPTTLDDAEFLLKLMNTPKWLENIGDRNVKTIEDAEAYINKRILPQFESVSYGNYTIIRKADKQRIGLCGLYKREGLDHTDIGFALLTEFENNGYAFESSKRILQAAFEDFNLQTIVAITNKENKSSQKLLKKLGLAHSGVTTLPNETKEVLVYKIENKFL